MSGLVFLTILIFLLMLFFVMPRVLYFSTLVYYAFKPKSRKKILGNYYLKDFKEMKGKKVVLK